MCQAFSTDSLELLLYHCSVGRSLPEAEWKEVAGDTHRCKLCCYGTQLKANFQLHLKTDKHAQKYQLAAHLREGSGAMGTPSPVPLGDGAPYGSVPTLHLRCNICDFESNSKEKMQLHARGAAHEENSQIYKVRVGRKGLGFEGHSTEPEGERRRGQGWSKETQSGKVMRKPRGAGLEKKGQGTRGKTIWRKTKGWWTLTK